MTRTITADLVEAYSLCPRKAFLLTAGELNPGPHEYVRMTDEQAAANRQAYRVRLARDLATVGCPADMAAGREFLADAGLETDGLLARCDF